MRTITPAHFGIILIAAAIALVAPFDIALNHASMGHAWLAGVIMAVIALCGGWLAQGAGLALSGPNLPRTLLWGLAGAVAMAAWVVMLDGFVFRSLLPAGYVEFIRSPLAGRLPWFMLRAFNENVLYRLFVFSALVWIVRRAAGGRSLAAPLMICLMILAQMLNIGMNVVAMADHAQPFVVLFYDGLRYIVPGVVWAWLFWRQGFFCAEIASVGCHIFLQPVLGALL